MDINNENTLVKNNGQVFTPDYIVDKILDMACYYDKNILKKDIIDNSCGSGAFLKKIVIRYCEQAFKLNYSIKEIKQDLETYIHGIEIDHSAYNECITSLNNLTQQFGISNIKWDILNDDTLTINKYDAKMDFVVGNPPYVRVHNLNNSYHTVKSFYFANTGMTDLYLVFYEIGFKMLKKGGKLSYITPSSWLTSLAGENMRKYIQLYKNLISLIDLEHYQPFNATAYTMITLFQKGIKKSKLSYYKYDSINKQELYICDLSFDEISISGKFYLESSHYLSKLRKIKMQETYKYAIVKNGFATLADTVFIGNVPQTDITIPIIKASTGKWYKGLFPYDKSGRPIPANILLKNKDLKVFFESHKKELVKGETDKENWFYYGRTQALKDVSKDKYALNTIIKDINSIKLNHVPAGSGVFSGLYILTEVPYDILHNIIVSTEFINYISSLKNYKNGGYYTFNSKDLEQYINYKLEELNYAGKHRNTNIIRQRSFFGKDF